MARAHDKTHRVQQNDGRHPTSSSSSALLIIIIIIIIININIVVISVIRARGTPYPIRCTRVAVASLARHRINYSKIPRLPSLCKRAAVRPLPFASTRRAALRRELLFIQERRGESFAHTQQRTKSHCLSLQLQLQHIPSQRLCERRADQSTPLHLTLEYCIFHIL